MAGYRRFVAYVYEYQKGKKGTNCGFIKVEIREQQCVMEIHLQCQGMTPDVPCSVYGFMRKDGLMNGVLLGSCLTKESKVECRIENDVRDMESLGISLDRMGGVILLTKAGGFYGTEWDDQPIRPENFQHNTAAARDSEETKVNVKADKKETNIPSENPVNTPEEKPTGNSEEKPAEMSSERPIGMSSERPTENKNERPVQKPEIRNIEKSAETQAETQAGYSTENRVQVQPDKNAKMQAQPDEDAKMQAQEARGLAWEIKRQSQDIRRQGTEETKPGQRKKIQGQKETSQVGKTESEGSKVQKEQAQETKKQPQEVEEQNKGVQQKTEAQIKEQRSQQRSQQANQQPKGTQGQARQNEEFYPFDDGEFVQCWKTQPGDCQRLSRRNCALRNNRFVLYGYYNFGHLLMARRLNGQFILGVPGGYDQQEKFMANMFGFPYFKESQMIKLPDKKGGYWYRLIDTPNFH